MALRVVSKVLALTFGAATILAQGNVEPTNSLPNPYQTIENPFALPAGRTWGSTSAVEIDKDGRSVWVGERCGENSCAGSPLASILKFGPSGELEKSFGGGMLLFPHGIHVDRDGNIWVTDDRTTRRGTASRPTHCSALHRVQPRGTRSSSSALKANC